MAIEKSILKRVRKFCTGSDENDFFDEDIIMGINTCFLTLTQLGLGPEEGFIIEGATEKWEDFTDDEILLTTVDSYVCRKTKLEFDPPASSALLTALKESVDQLEWRLRHAVEIQLKEG